MRLATIIILLVSLPCFASDKGKAVNVDVLSVNWIGRARVRHINFASIDEKLGVKPKFKTIEMTITFYCPCKVCCGKYGEKYTTADNTYFKGKYNFRCVAADRKFYKMGTRFEIGGVIYAMHDVGGAIKGNHLDVLVYPYADLKKCHKLALKLGKKKVMVKVYE